MLLFAASAAAQQGLGINAVFNGSIVPQEQMVKVKVKGKALSKYRLNFYHSVRFTTDNRRVSEVERLLEAEKNTAIDKEETTRKNGRTLILRLPPQRDTNRYICYLVSGGNNEYEVTLVYMEGKVENIDRLRTLIK